MGLGVALIHAPVPLGLYLLTKQMNMNYDYDTEHFVEIVIPTTQKSEEKRGGELMLGSH